MDITSFFFLCFYAVVLGMYYAVPGRFRWCVLLAASVAGYLSAGEAPLIVYPLSASFVTFGATAFFARSGSQRVRRAVFLAALLFLFGTLAVLKYLRLTAGQGALPHGLSFYTFLLAGYLIDVYNGIAEGTTPARTVLYGMYFPLLVSGPILKVREDGAQFFEPHPLSYRNLTFGTQRMLWGFFQKLVISERLAVIVAEIYDHPEQYGGAYVAVGTVAFAFRLYTDFAGCMDIVLGLSETFGLTLPENFDLPFFAETISDYWRRWHITLGAWMRDYVFYPLLRTKLFFRLSTFFRKKLGKKRGGRVANYFAMFILWFTVGLWHGGALKFIIGSGLLHFAYIVAGELILPGIGRFLTARGCDLSGRLFRVLRVLRTFFLVNIGFVFFRADSTAAALRMLQSAVTVWNPQVLFDGSLLALGLDWIEMTITLVSLAGFIAVSVMKLRVREQGEVHHHLLRERIARQSLPIRWAVWFALLFYVILLGRYGPGYSAAEFIYQGF